MDFQKVILLSLALLNSEAELIIKLRYRNTSNKENREQKNLIRVDNYSHCYSQKEKKIHHSNVYNCVRTLKVKKKSIFAL